MKGSIPRVEWERHVWNEARVDACPAYRVLFVQPGLYCHVVINNAIMRTRQAAANA